MSKKNGKPVRMFSAVIGPASADDVHLAQAVEQRFLDLCESWLRLKKVELPIPGDLDKDFLLWRQAMARFKVGDMRNTIDERDAVRRIAQWTLDMNCELRNQPKKTLEWSS